MPEFIDPEFGEIVVKRQALSKRLSLRIAPDGRIRISMPLHTPLISAKMLVRSSREQIREIITEHHKNLVYTKDQPIGKSHHLFFQEGNAAKVKISKTKIIVNTPPDTDTGSIAIQNLIRPKIAAALRKEAKSYLPRRLEFIARENGFFYKKIRLTHSSSRWGSCSSSGTISLNIALMNLPFELIDYVIIHELAHTREMNHSKNFWTEVSAVDPDYQKHRTMLKKHSPNI